MEVFYWKSAYGNFGDDLNEWLWDYLLPGIGQVETDRMLVGVGTLLNTTLMPADRRKLVVGSGVGYGAAPTISDQTLWDIRCVRGPMTARMLGLDEGLGIADPAVMIADMPEFKGLDGTAERIFVPHWKTVVNGTWDVPKACSIADLHYVSPCGDAKSIIRKIAQAELVVAESMHAAIIADAFRVPWVAVASRRINAFKWRDWAATLDLTYDPVRLPFGHNYAGVRRALRRFGVDAEKLSARGTPDRSAASSAPQRRPRALELIKQTLAIPAGLALRRALKREPQLSAPGRTEERQGRLHAVLNGVSADLGLS